MKVSILIVISLLLASCQTVGTRGCIAPPLVAYSPQKMKQAAAAIRKLPPDSPLHALLSDYHRTRDAIRLCNQ